MQNTLGFNYKEYEIIGKVALAPDTVLFRLKGAIKFNPGQFVEVSLPRFGEGTFAVCSDPEEKKFFELCVRSCGNLSNQLIKLLPGDFINLRGPYGNGWPIGKLIGKNIILIAGGMGMVPIRPLVYELLQYRSDFKKIYLFGGFKTPHHVLFEEELKKWQNKIDLEICVEHTERNFWCKHSMITDPLKEIKIEKKKTVVLICGPEVMVPFCNEILIKKGMKEKDIYISFERRMECGIGVCQHCNIGKYLVCKDGPVFSYEKIKNEIGK